MPATSSRNDLRLLIKEVFEKIDMGFEFMKEEEKPMKLTGLLSDIEKINAQTSITEQKAKQARLDSFKHWSQEKVHINLFEQFKEK